VSHNTKRENESGKHYSKIKEQEDMLYTSKQFVVFTAAAPK
jgi:hypothetical protein